MLEELPKKYRHYYFVRYEDLRDNYETVLNSIYIQFKLRRTKNTYIQVTRYKGSLPFAFNRQPILLTDTIKKYIWENVDNDQENEMGYICADKSS